ncbi:MAG TPA: hypothetical protein ENK17_02205 [Anaerolineae bacterium]|nr:hypothetical protein [Anaerolineae bacterium]
MGDVWAVLTNPNVVYILFVIGLWATAAAIYVPGTGFLEAAALACLVLAVAGFTRLPVNVVGVLLIVVAGVLFVVDLHVQSIGITVVGAGSLVAGSVLLFPSSEGLPSLSPWAIVVMVLLSLGFAAFLLAAAVRAQGLRRKAVPEEVIGQRGVVTAPLTPVGTVQVAGELWTAFADEPLAVGEEVEVVALDGLKVRVKRVTTTKGG